jgi:transketolase
MPEAALPRSLREAYGEALVELGEQLPEVVVLDADLSRSTMTAAFRARFPQRSYNLGLAEANMIGIAAGLASTGRIPFATTYAMFVCRAFEQIRQAVAGTAANVKIVGTHAGLAAGYDGGTHQALEDVALMRVLPGMTVLSPADFHEARQAVHAAARQVGPVYLRLGRDPVPCWSDPSRLFEIGRAWRLTEGSDVAILATGTLVAAATAAAAQLGEVGIGAAVTNVSTLKPLDEATVIAEARRCACVVTVEEHSRIGGLFEAVAGALAGRVLAPIEPVAMADRFGESGSWEELLGKYGLSREGIVEAAMRAIAGKGSRGESP